MCMLDVYTLVYVVARACYKIWNGNGNGMERNEIETAHTQQLSSELFDLVFESVK